MSRASTTRGLDSGTKQRSTELGGVNRPTSSSPPRATSRILPITIWTGYLTDEDCGIRGGQQGELHLRCAQKCIREGKRPYLYSDGKLFELTPKVLSLGHTYLSSLDFWEAARPYLADVTRLTRESSSAAVLDGPDVVYVARSAAPHRIMSVALNVGTRLPAHATSMGQILLSAMPQDALQAYLDRAPFERFTRRTLVGAGTLRERLRMVQQHGYAMADQELEEGLRSLAVPIRQGQDDGKVLAALNVSAHSARISKSAMIRDFLPHLRRAADKIGEMAR